MNAALLSLLLVLPLASPSAPKAACDCAVTGVCTCGPACDCCSLTQAKLPQPKGEPIPAPKSTVPNSPQVVGVVVYAGPLSGFHARRADRLAMRASRHAALAAPVVVLVGPPAACGK